MNNIELKRFKGISQMLRNQGEKEIPQLFKYIQITLAGNNHSAQYGTTGTPKKFYAVWNERNEEYIETCNNLITNRTPSNSNPKIKLHNISFHIYILFGLASNKYIFQHFIKAFKIKHCC